ncbi:hypothetical protein [Roseivirga misakiensis]|uniref:Lipocalin-like domain-containing protein n=1 Tax=Roseivirga misakiensis TaxID=1563681 RepID=A0A1E5T4C1_9BACT|nr:hypothetical protein [Roseivirga misakiensis]OEK06228.1 hypothetical protein BFP71_00695 [Roseivirga misakiensis]
MKRIILFVLVLGITCSCTKSNRVDPSQIVGTWENTELDVDIKTYNKTNLDSALQIELGEWEAILKLKPIKTTYFEDGTFVAKYFDLEGNPVGEEKGDWKIVNDSLAINSAGYKNIYHVTFKADKARFISILDWDQDGDRDDLYDGWQKKVN